jgi:ABC-2 type transport system ATP-binding protein
VKPSGGDGKLLGKPLGDTEARRQLGFLPEQFRFHEWLRAEEFLDFHASLYGVPKRERPRRIADVLGLIGLEARAQDALRTFSKGMLQRIGIGQALIGDPKVVILDEPTSALDPIGRREVRDLIRTLRSRGVAVFLNSHLLSEVEMVCDRVAIIDRGRVVRQGRMDELARGALELEVRVEGASDRLLAEIERRWPRVTRSGGPTTPSSEPEGIDGTGARTLRYALREDAEVAQVADLIVRDGARLLALVPHQATLEDLFIESVESRDV